MPEIRPNAQSIVNIAWNINFVKIQQNLKVLTFRTTGLLDLFIILKTKFHGLSPRANYTDRRLSAK
jgi:hypothetical protein